MDTCVQSWHRNIGTWPPSQHDMRWVHLRRDRGMNDWPLENCSPLVTARLVQWDVVITMFQWTNTGIDEEDDDDGDVKDYGDSNHRKTTRGLEGGPGTMKRRRKKRLKWGERTGWEWMMNPEGSQSSLLTRWWIGRNWRIRGQKTQLVAIAHRHG